MTLKTLDSYASLSEYTAQKILDLVKQNPNAVLCLASGSTPDLTFDLLVSHSKKQNIDFKDVHFIGLDEWVGVAPDNSGSCRYCLDHKIFNSLGIRENQIHFFNGLSHELEGECTRINLAIEQLGGIDLMLVGVGMNGHIGFNEPGVSIDLNSHVVNLDEVTRTVGQKYFKQPIDLQKGITLGLKQFMDARSAVMMISGTKKKDIVHKLLTENISTDLPATFIRKHNNGLLLIDQDAAALVSGF